MAAAIPLDLLSPFRMSRNNGWNPNIWERVYNNNLARGGYYTAGYAQRKPVDNANNNRYTDRFYQYNNGNAQGRLVEKPGPAGMFGDQFHLQQFQIWENRGQGQFGFQRQVISSNNQGYQHQVFSYASNNKGQHVAIAFQQNNHNKNYVSQDNGNLPNAKRIRWDRPGNVNQVVPCNVHNQNFRRIIRCYNCNETFTTYKALHQHRDTYHPKPRSFYCSICNKEYPTHALMKKHELTHTVNACQKCPEIFKYKDSLVAHMKHAHSAQPPALPTIAEDSGTEADQGQDASAPGHHSIEKLEKTDKYSFTDPTAASTPLAEKKDFTESPDNSDSGVKSELFRCPHCIKSFDSEAKMNSHCKIHTEADEDNSSSSESDKSEDKSLLACPFCIKKFRDKRGLTLHMSSVHTQSFYCPKCPAEFSSQKKLTVHKNSHK